MSTTLKFSDLNCVDEFIEFPFVEPVIVYGKYGKGDGYICLLYTSDAADE